MSRRRWLGVRPMVDWFRRSVAAKVGLIAGASAAAGGAAFLLLWPWLSATPDAPGQSPPLAAWLVAVGLGAVGAGTTTWALVRVFVARRLTRLARAVGKAERGDFLARARPQGTDEIAMAGAAFNRLLAKITDLNVDVIDTHRVLEATQEELRLKEALAAKSAALESRLAERALLFETLRIFTSSLDLDEILGALAERVAKAIHAREVAVLVAQDDRAERFVLRSGWGFPANAAVVGRSLARGEGIAGMVAEAKQPLVVADVSLEPDYLAFWGEVPRTGSFAAVPIAHRGQLLGLLCLTHEEPRAFDEALVKLASAFADQAALAVRNAQLYASMRELSVTDELTGLANRRRLFGRLSREWDRIERSGEPFSVLALDVDNFKALNDREGHPVGDACLRLLGDTLASQFRRVDTPARIGGEEFLVLLSGTGLSEATSLAEKLRTRVASTDYPGGTAQPGGRFTISIGVASTAQGANDLYALLAQADAALYAAKHDGRNRVVAYHPDMPVAIAAIPGRDSLV